MAVAGQPDTPTDGRRSLEGRRVVLGVSGGIAAYKAVDVLRRLMDAGAHVSPVLTDDATRFVGALTFSALASEPVRTTLWDSPEPIPHTRLGQAADLVIVAPATARLIAAYVAGLSDDLLVATLLATRAPVLICPAMHTEMWEHPAVMDNMALLRRRGVHVVDPESGRLAGGDVGAGRLADPGAIVAAAARILQDSSADSPAGSATGGRSADSPAGRASGGDLSGLKVVVTAGGTREAIDPVRYIANRSSGRQGHALAEAAVSRGASVTLISTTAPPAGYGGATPIMVESAAEMESAVTKAAAAADVVIMAAAVADFRPKAVASSKLKKADGVPDIVLEPTTDILAALGALKPSAQILVGFAAETPGGAGHDSSYSPAASVGAGATLVEMAREKLYRKGADLIVANDVGAPGAGFGYTTNAVTMVDRHGVTEVPLADKLQVAHVVLDAVVGLIARKEERA